MPRYNPADSSSAAGPAGTARIVYGSDGEAATGVELQYYKDNVSFGGELTITRQQLGVATGSLGLATGILGLAPDMYNGFALNKSYPRVLDSLFAQNRIDSRAYSLSLGRSVDPEGSLMFGGYDRSRFTGSLATLPIVRSRDNVTRYVKATVKLGQRSTIQD